MVRKDYDRQLGDVDARMEKWHELSVKTFNFACYARYWFKNGDITTKTQILSAIGSNLRIFERTLLVDGEHSFFLIEKGKQKVTEN